MVEWNNGSTVTRYAYILNLQGDVLGLRDSAGTEVVRYTYDAWGKILSTTGSLAATLGKLNPFRYRGYVYDEETGLYYLRSRYYAAHIGRFINADSVIATFNLFRYCNNTPTNRIDLNGKNGNIAIMNERTILHNHVVTLVQVYTNGIVIRSKTRIPNAGRRGGPGYPDVIDNFNHAWDIKPLSHYGLSSGSAQLKRYTTNTGYLPGYPVLIPSFPYVLGGKEGKVNIQNGSIATGDAGVVYYEFVANEDDDTAEETVPESVPEVGIAPVQESQNEVNWGTIAVAVLLLALTLASPIPGDEAIPLGVLLAPI